MVKLNAVSHYDGVYQSFDADGVNGDDCSVATIYQLRDSFAWLVWRRYCNSDCSRQQAKHVADLHNNLQV